MSKIRKPGPLTMEALKLFFFGGNANFHMARGYKIISFSVVRLNCKQGPLYEVYARRSWTSDDLRIAGFVRFWREENDPLWFPDGGPGAEMAETFKYLEQAIKGTHEPKAEIIHCGLCGRCGQGIYSEDAVKTGFGSGCRYKTKHEQSTHMVVGGGE